MDLSWTTIARLAALMLGVVLPPLAVGAKAVPPARISWRPSPGSRDRYQGRLLYFTVRGIAAQILIPPVCMALSSRGRSCQALEA